MRIFSPAKLNLFFRVLRKQEDGFHEIASLYQAIDLGDELEFNFSNQDIITCSDPTLSCGEDNLIRKALCLFREKTGLKDFFLLCNLQKKIPIQTGIGGGSSNAATTLFACNELAGRPATLEQLSVWAAEIGSDVSFFFSSGSAYCTGRGEILRDVSYPTEKVFQGKCFLAKPEFGLSTPEVYKACRPSELQDRNPLEVLDSFQRGFPIWFNDLEEAATRVSDRFAPFKDQLKACGFTQVVLTGSGSGCFCFGLEEAPNLPNIRFFPIRTLARNSSGWYTPIID